MKNRLFPFHQAPASENFCKNRRLIVIGDVHGCIRELEKLIKKIKPKKKDEILFLGDLVNRGPDSKAVVRLARDIKARSLIGNHELRLLRYYHDKNASAMKDYDLRTMDSLGAKEWNYIASMILWLEWPKEKKVFVHGGFLPDQSWKKQLASVVTQIKNVTRNGHYSIEGSEPGSRFWADLWGKNPFVIYGHTPRSEVYITKYSMGLDTGCVWGGRLTAYIFPENKIVQVAAEKKYIR